MKFAQLCPTLCDPVDYTVHGILQARILEWIAFPFSRGSSQPRDWSQVSHIAGGFFTSWATREAKESWSGQPIPSLVNLPNPGIKLGSPALQVDSLPTELSGKHLSLTCKLRLISHIALLGISSLSKLWIRSIHTLQSYLIGSNETVYQIHSIKYLITIPFSMNCFCLLFPEGNIFFKIILDHFFRV